METPRTLSCVVLCIFFLTSVFDKSESACPTNDDFTTNSQAEIITADDGVTYRGVRFTWTYNQNYVCSDFHYYRAYVNGQLPLNRRSYEDITFSTNQVEFLNLDCNTDYTFYVQYVNNRYYKSSDTPLFYGNPMNSPPAQIASVIAQLDSLDPNLRLSVYWDSIPCHLQNGGDVSDYIIQYGLVGTDEVRSITTSDERLSCVQEPVGPFRCYLTSTLLLEDQLYIFQVAGVNGYGVGPFSSPINATLYSQASAMTTRAEEQESTASDSRPTEVWILTVIQIVIVIVFFCVLIIILVMTSVLWKRMNVPLNTNEIRSNKRSDKAFKSQGEAYGMASADNIVYDCQA